MTSKPRTWWEWARDAWAPAGAHWLLYFLTGLLSLGLAILFAWMAAQGDRFGLPPPERIHTVEGVIQSSGWNQSDTTIYLEGETQEFRYISKAGDASLVAREATPGRAVRLIVDAEDLDDKATKFVGVFGVTVEGRVVRAFDEVVDHWRANNRVGYWLIAAFGPAGILCMVTAWRLYRAGRMPPAAETN